MATTRRTSQKISHPKRGEIYLTALDPTVGREIRKTRPALIIRNPVHVLLSADHSTGLSVVSVALFSQIRAVDCVRLVKRLGQVDEETLARVDEAIRISLGLISI
jgi:mRNA interferase MazF